MKKVTDRGEKRKILSEVKICNVFGDKSYAKGSPFE